MTRSELLLKLAERRPDLPPEVMEKVFFTVFGAISQALAQGKRVELRGFGAFSVKHREPRTGRNPRTGASVKVAEKFTPFFKTGKLLRDRLNGEASVGEGTTDT